MSIKNHGNKKWTSFIFIPDHTQIFGPRSILKETKMKEMDSLFKLSLLFGTWLEVTTLINGFTTKINCQIKRIIEANQSIIVNDEHESTLTIELETITNVIALKL
ncbi:YolD-like family protein [Bacillus sp. ISL-7]|uniref:YolD-like family protein n=1 Tax=Bacillus sp. ISL-7 TaxID=2819136 RepID=UPI001BE7F5F5|nr:YolD-like family protein [Bacillus sp. ISL-7]MBT2734729.1 YolD-like family protein [Bacillus sp. ISL-7]